MSAPLPPSTRLAAQRGDRAARAELVAVYGGLVFSLCRRYATDPEDAYQDAWVHVLSRLHRYDETRGASLRTWLALIVRNRLTDRRRVRRIRGEVVAPDEAQPSPDPTPEQHAHRRRQVQRVERALSHLDPVQRDAIVLHYTADMPLSDIARAQGVAVGTVKSRLHRARAHLAALMERS
ncbi:MAG: sigma-70 family RNA polymerase sigma factor [Myxococcota bacterium]